MNRSSLCFESERIVNQAKNPKMMNISGRYRVEKRLPLPSLTLSPGFGRLNRLKQMYVSGTARKTKGKAMFQLSKRFTKKK